MISDIIDDFVDKSVIIFSEDEKLYELFNEVEEVEDDFGNINENFVDVL